MSQLTQIKPHQAVQFRHSLRASLNASIKKKKFQEERRVCETKGPKKLLNAMYDPSLVHPALEEITHFQDEQGKMAMD